MGNTIAIIEDFNIRDCNWDPNFPHHSIYTKELTLIADSLGLELSPPVNPGPTRYADNPRNTNSVLDLVFLLHDNREFSKHTLHPDRRKPSDYVSMSIKVEIKDEDINVII